MGWGEDDDGDRHLEEVEDGASCSIGSLPWLYGAGESNKEHRRPAKASCYSVPNSESEVLYLKGSVLIESLMEE